LAIPSKSIGLSPNQTLPIDKAGPSHLNLLQPIGEPSSEPIVSNLPSQNSKTSSSSEYYLPHVFCEGICISRLNIPRVCLTNRRSGEKGEDAVLYENPIGLDDADEYYSTDGEPIVELKTLVQSKVKGSWNFLYQPFPTYWNFESSSESNKDSREFSNPLVGESEFQRELIQVPIVPLASIVIFDRNFLNPSSEPIVNNQQLIVYNPLIVPLSNRINPMADQANLGDSLIPMTMRPGQPDDRPTSVVTLPKFYGELGSDPDYHVREFLTACNANSARIPSHWHAIFPTTLDGHARQWFYRQPLGHFATWTALKDAFIAKFRLVAYTDRLTEQMHDLQMTNNETIDNFYGRMEDIILRLPPGHAFNDEMKKSIFIRGLLPFKLKAYVKEIEPTPLDEAYQRAKKYENIYTALDDAPVLSYINSTPVTTTQIVPISNPVIYPPQVGLQSTIKIPNPPMVNHQGGNQSVNVGNKSENDLLRQRLEDLTLQMGELRVHQANAANQ
jgi:hypothetical protein